MQTEILPRTQTTVDQFMKIARPIGWATIAILLIQWVFAANSIQAWEFIFPAFIIIDQAVRLGFFNQYYGAHEKIAATLSVSRKEYFQTLKQTEEPNMFNFLLLVFFGDIQLAKEKLDISGTWTQAKFLADRAKNQLQQVQEIVSEAGMAKTKTDYAVLIRNELTKRNFSAARKYLAESKEKARKEDKEYEEILQEAAEANCDEVIENHFIGRKFNGREARNLIALAQAVQKDAERYEVEETVIEKLKEGSLPKAKSVLHKAKRRKWLQNQKNARLSFFKDQIKQKQERNRAALYKELEQLEGKPFGSRAYRKACRALEDKIEDTE